MPACLARVGGSPRRLGPNRAAEFRFLGDLSSFTGFHRGAEGAPGLLLQARWRLQMNRFLPAEPPSASKPRDDAFSSWNKFLLQLARKNLPHKPTAGTRVSLSGSLVPRLPAQLRRHLPATSGSTTPAPTTTTPTPLVLPPHGHRRYCRPTACTRTCAHICWKTCR